MTFYTELLWHHVWRTLITTSRSWRGSDKGTEWYVTHMGNISKSFADQLDRCCLLDSACTQGTGVSLHLWRPILHSAKAVSSITRGAPNMNTLNEKVHFKLS